MYYSWTRPLTRPNAHWVCPEYGIDVCFFATPSRGSVGTVTYDGETIAVDVLVGVEERFTLYLPRGENDRRPEDELLWCTYQVKSGGTEMTCRFHASNLFAERFGEQGEMTFHFVQDERWPEVSAFRVDEKFWFPNGHWACAQYGYDLQFDVTQIGTGSWEQDGVTYTLWATISPSGNLWLEAQPKGDAGTEAADRMLLHGRITRTDTGMRVESFGSDEYGEIGRWVEFAFVPDEQEPGKAWQKTRW